jgi:diguanylate cyclase (GGDEF)-like protein/PAS domain S-box-containing protein
VKRSKLKVLAAILLALVMLGRSDIRAKAHAHHEMDFYEIFNNNGTIILLISGKTGDILHANRSAGEFYGYSITQLESMNMSQINNIPVEAVKRRAAAAANEDRTKFVLEQVTADGEQRIVEAYVCPHEQDDDIVLFATIFDITEKVRLEKRNKLISGVLFVSLSAAIIFLLLFLLLRYKHSRNLKKYSEKVSFINFHDALTGLYNRMYMEQEIGQIDTPGNLPLSVVYADVNGLKLTNDIFGHESGDLLLKKAAEIFHKVCRKEDIIARIGGDEFIILMPNTEQHEAEAIVEQIKRLFSLEKIRSIKGSISIGVSTKVNKVDDINNIISIAEMKMYSQKSLERGQVKKSTINSIVELLHNDNPEEESHARSVSKLSEVIGRALGLTEEEIRKLKEAGWLHDIGKVILDKSLLNIHRKPLDQLSDEQVRKIRQHPVVGYRILISFDETLDIAGLVLTHHEYWDGSGYPKGLKREEIPFLTRIITAAEYYDTMVQRNMDTDKITEELMTQSGKRLDPRIASVLIEMNRVTVIAGENSAGKSTVGKVLVSI